MNFYSTNNTALRVDFATATVQGQAPDKGLFFPEKIPFFSPEEVMLFKKLPLTEVAYRVLSPFVGHSLSESVLREIIDETLCFEMPLVKVHDDIYSLELFHGPTLAFKDIGARFMSRCLKHLSVGTQKKIVVLVATSGDTGGAVASGFAGVEGVEVVILYPKGRVSSVQELQLTTGGKNVWALEVEGTFDDCQRLVKAAFTDQELQEKYFLTSANSINVARWLPQQMFYWSAWQQWPGDMLPIISVPSGNFGNICSGMLAHKMGLPVQHFIAACNANDVIPEFLESGFWKDQPAIATLSNAMDVAVPSNFIRMQHLYGMYMDALKADLTAVSITDAETLTVMDTLKSRYGYTVDPHGAVGYEALMEYLESKELSWKGIFLATAHPVKFPEAWKQLNDVPIPEPETVAALRNKESRKQGMKAEGVQLKQFLLEHL